MGCVSPSYYRYVHGVRTPNSVEANACRRQCIQSIGVCRNYTYGKLPVYIEAGTYSAAYGCPGVFTDCLLLCPGAELDEENPPAMVPSYPPKGPKGSEPTGGWSRASIEAREKKRAE